GTLMNAVTVAMRVLTVARFGLATISAKECHEPQPEHVERGQECGEDADHPVNPACLVRTPEDFVFAEESGERRNARNRKGSDRHGPKGDGDLGAEAAHPAHVLLTANGMNHRACGQE